MVPRSSRLPKDEAGDRSTVPPRAPDVYYEKLLLGRDDDLAPRDVGLCRLELVLDAVDLATRRGVAHAVDLEVEDGRAGRELAVGVFLDEVEHRVVDPLEHRGHDARLERGVTDGVVLVRVDADGQALLVLGGLEDAGARAAGRGVDDV